MGLSPADVCRSYLDSFASGDPAAIAAHVTEDFANEHTSALGSGCVGRAAYADRLPGFLASMPGLRYEVEELIASGSRVAVAYTLRACVGERPIGVPGMMRFEVRDGLIARRVDYWDSLLFQRQARSA